MTITHTATAPPSLTSALDCDDVLESLPHIVWVKSADGAAEYLNRLGAQYFGRDAADTLGWTWMQRLHPDDVVLARDAWALAIRNRTPYETSLRVRRSDGQYRWMSSRGLPVFAPDGTVRNWVGTLTDVDDSVRRDERLQQNVREAAETVALLDTLQSKAPVGFLFVDAEYRYVRINETMAEINGLPVEEHLGRTVAEVVPDLWPQIQPVYARVLDTGEPTLNLEMSGETAAEPGVVRHWITNFYPVRVDGATIGIGVVVIDLTERVRSEQTIRSLTEAAVGAVAAAIEARDPYTAGHQRRVSLLATAIAKGLGLDEPDVEGIRLAAKIHDIGKISIPSEILSKPGRLSATEFELVKTHSQAGHDIIQGIDFPWPVAAMILQHHARLDGGGYPNGLVGEDISIGARIIAVADTVEAMSSHRPYRPSRGLDAALDEIERNRGKLYDTRAVDACLHLFHGGSFRFTDD